MSSREKLENLEKSEMVGYVTQKWSRTVVQPVLIALMITAFFTAILTTIPLLTSVPGTLLWTAPLIFITCLEAVYTTIWLHGPRRRQLNHLAYRAAEFLAVALLLRGYVWLLPESHFSLADLPLLLRNPFNLLADNIFIISLIFIFVAWLRAILVATDFAELAIDRAESYYFTLPDDEKNPGMKPAYSNRGAILEDIFQQWVVGGMILAFVTAVISIDPLNYSFENGLIGLQTLNLPPIYILALLSYFISGLVLISQARLGALNARWLHQGVLKAPDVERFWHKYTVRILLLFAFIALFLPLGSTFAIGRILEVILFGLISFVALMGYLFTFLLGAFLSLFPLPNSGGNSEATPEAVVPTPEPTSIPPTATPPNPSDEILQILLSSAFWAVAIVVTAIALSFFLRDRGVSINPGTFKQFGVAVLAWFRNLWRDASDYAEDLRHSVRRRVQRKPKVVQDSDPSWRFFRLNALSPRDQIRYFYLSTVRRAKERGVSRLEGETPLEYAEDLKETWPEADAEIDELTDAFIQARYSQKEFEKETLNPIKKKWKRVKKNLRKR